MKLYKIKNGAIIYNIDGKNQKSVFPGVSGETGKVQGIFGKGTVPYGKIGGMAFLPQEGEGRTDHL